MKKTGRKILLSGFLFLSAYHAEFEEITLLKRMVAILYHSDSA